MLTWEEDVEAAAGATLELKASLCRQDRAHVAVRLCGQRPIPLPASGNPRTQASGKPRRPDLG
jgi:hypothetical protein